MPYEEHLDGGLVLRAVRNDLDKERFAAFNAECNNPSEGATCACLLHHHPETTPDDYWLVEDEATGQVVSTTLLLPWNGRFGGIDLRLAQLEMVLTRPQYRGQGLVRLQMKHFEQVVKERGCHLSLIWGIPYYYRQFGYAYAIDGDFRQALPVWKIPAANPGSTAQGYPGPVRLRPAAASDIPQLIQDYAAAVADLDFYIQRSPQYWRYLLEDAHHPIEIVEDAQTGASLGYVTLIRSAAALDVLESGLASPETALKVLQALKPQANQQVLIAGPVCSALVKIAISLGSQAAPGLQWLLRLPDVAGFLSRIGPILEQRLRDAGWSGLSSELVINLFRQAFRLHFEAGRLAQVDSLGFVDASMGADGGHLLIPPEAFVRLVFGYRGLDDLRDAWPDTLVRPEVRQLVETLFPSMQSYLYTPYHYLG